MEMMSGAEADISSDGDSSCFEDDDVPLPKSPLKEGTDEPFQVILKGGSPWGFSLKGGAEPRSPVQVAEIEAGGRASDNGMRVGDYLLQVNNIACNSLAEAEELIQSAFRTLTLQLWRGATESTVTSPTRSASFLQKARELSERARQAAQDDSALFSETKRMKPRQRRIESFHGSRRGSSQSSSSSVVAPGAPLSHPAQPPSPRSAQYAQQPPPPTTTAPSSTEGGSTVAKPPLKGWATEHDLSHMHKPVIMSSSGGHASVPPSSRHMPLTPAKSSPSLNQEEVGVGMSMSNVVTPRGYKKTPPTLSMTKSTPDIADQNNDHVNVTSPTSPRSPSWYQKLPNRSTFDFQQPNIRRSPRSSYASGSPRNSFSSGSPRNSYAGGSPRNSYAGYGSLNPPQTSVPAGFAPTSVPASSYVFSQSTPTDTNSQRNSVNQPHTQKLIGANSNSYDDSPSYPHTKSHDRRSLPPQALYQLRHDFQKEQIKQEQSKPLSSMPVTREEEEADKEILKSQPPSDLDLRSTYTAPAPPIRDISSLKYVGYQQNHEKFPSWPVTLANPPQNLGPPVDAHANNAVKDRGLEPDHRDSRESVSKSSDRSSSSSELKSGEETNKSRNQSDPGFTKKQKASFYTTRKPNYESPQEPDYENLKSEEERFNDFCRKAQPGYPPPKLDPDGHNIGDEKYSIPSPPERDMPNLDEKSLVEKIAAVISPGSTHQPASFQYPAQYHAGAEPSSLPVGKSDMATSPQAGKVPGVYFQQAMNAQNLLRSTSVSKVPQGKNMVDSGTSPLHSPSEEKAKFSLRTVTPNPNPKNDNFLSPTDRSRGLIIRQMPYYNTSTQTDDLGNQSRSERNSFAEEHSEQHSQSSGFASMTFSDHSSAPMLRKLSEEFYRGKLSGTVPNEKRMSSASEYHDLKSPRSESHYGSLKEAESYSSVVIHPHESAGLFGKDDFGSNPSIVSSRPEMSDTDHENSGEHRLAHKSRYSMDSAMILQKASASGVTGAPPRSLTESRFTSESNLSSGSFSARSQNYSHSLLHLNRPASSLGTRLSGPGGAGFGGEGLGSQPGSSVGDGSQGGSQSRYMQYSSESSSSSSRPRGSLEARSSGSRLSSGSSSGIGGQKMDSRNNSDSVFVYDDKVPSDSAGSQNVPEGRSQSSGSQSGVPDGRSQSVGVGRKESMKMAFGTYDEHEHHYATPYGHQRNNSEVLSSNAHDPNIVHGRSASYSGSDYLPMHYNQMTADSQRLGQIQEEGSELRWQEAVRKTRSLSRDAPSNYENVQLEAKNSDEQKENKTGMRRTVSEQIRPKKIEKKAGESVDLRKDYSSSGESGKENKSDSDSVQRPMSQQLSDSNLKQMQQKAVLDFVERKSKESRSSDSSEPQSPKLGPKMDEFPQPLSDTKSQSSSSPGPTPNSPLPDISKRYHYTRAQRNESLKRTRSISSNSSRDSTDYMEMKRLNPNYQTEWSRLRSQDGVMPRRPLSIGSDIMVGENAMATSSPLPTPEEGDKSLDETLVKKPFESEATEQQTPLTADGPPSVAGSIGNEAAMVTSPIYQNTAGDYPRRPPPPVPGVTSTDAPPAIPPRNYPRFTNSKSESFLLSRLDPQQAEEIQETYNKDGTVAPVSTAPGSGPPGSETRKWENGTLREDAYAQQLRRQARRFSEQQLQKPISMQVVSTKSTMQVSLSQSYKQEPAAVLEAVPAQKGSAVSPASSTTSSGKHKHSPSARPGMSPEPPPMPTPLKNGETEFKEDVSRSEFPPPPSEFMEDGNTSGEPADRCADDSYGSHKTRGQREVGKYNRAKSDSNVVRLAHEARATGQYRQQDLNGSSRDGAETPNKPPRRKLDLQGRGSPVHGSPNMQGSDPQLAGPMPGPQVPTFVPAEVSSVQHVQKSVAKPLQALSVQKLNAPTSSGGIVSTVVQKPSSASPSPEKEMSVRDRIKSIEVFSNSPGSKKNENSVEGGTQGREADSLEQLESSIKSSDSFRDRLRPVVRKVEQEQTDNQPKPVHHVNNDKAGGDAVDKFDMPPQVPQRTYRQLASSTGERPPRPYPKPSERADPVFRKANIQNHSPQLTHPRPYDNKPAGSVHSPVGSSNYTGYHRAGSPKDQSQRSPGQLQRSPGQSFSEVQQRSPSQSVPEPQVPSRQPLQRKLAPNDQIDNKKRDQNENFTSPEQKVNNHYVDENVRNRDHTQNQSVHTAHKRNYDSSFPSSKAHSDVSPSQSHHRNSSSAVSPSNKNSDKPVEDIHNQPNRPHVNTRNSEGNMGGNSQRTELRGSYSSDQRQNVDSSELRSPTTPTYHRGDFRLWKSESSSHVKSPSTDSQASPNTSIHSPQNSTTSNTASLRDSTESKGSKPPPLVNVSVNHGRQPSAEELDCDKKAQELAKVLADSDHALSQVLTTDSNKIRMRYLDGILPVESEPAEQRRPRSASKKEDRVDQADKAEEKKSNEPTSPMPSNYYVSPPKAMIELEIRKFGDTSQLTQDIDDNDTLAQKKEELLARMVKKLDILKDDKNELTVDIEENEALGKQVQLAVEQKCRSQQEKDKYRAYIEDMDKIIRLLLKLSGLLARAENTIQGLNDSTNEKIKKMTFDKRDRLHKQHEDAKELKSDIDRRSEQIETYLRESLAASELDDYHYYIKMKSKYTIQMQELEDKITLGNEQISALQKSIPAKGKS